MTNPQDSLIQLTDTGEQLLRLSNACEVLGIHDLSGQLFHHANHILTAVTEIKEHLEKTSAARLHEAQEQAATILTTLANGGKRNGADHTL